MPRLAVERIFCVRGLLPQETAASHLLQPCGLPFWEAAFLTFAEKCSSMVSIHGSRQFSGVFLQKGIGDSPPHHLWASLPVMYHARVSAYPIGRNSRFFIPGYASCAPGRHQIPPPSVHDGVCTWLRRGFTNSGFSRILRPPITSIARQNIPAATLRVACDSSLSQSLRSDALLTRGFSEGSDGACTRCAGCVQHRFCARSGTLHSCPVTTCSPAPLKKLFQKN